MKNEMKNILSAAGAFLLGLTVSAADLDGSWSLNAWKGYKPAPDMEKTADGGISLTNVTAKYGVGLISRKRISSKAGDVMKFTALVKGRGKIFFQLQDYDASGKWLGVAGRAVRADLTSEWREITLSTKVENHKERVTAFSVATTGVGKGGELHIRKTRMEREESEFSGDCVFPRHWHVFAPVPPEAAPTLDKIPEQIGGVSGKTVSLDNNTIVLAPFFPERKVRNTAWLFAEFDAPSDGLYTIGAGADYFMAVHVNGKCIIDTLKSGDASGTPHFSNHKANASVRKGKNVIAVKFQSGSGNNPRISLGGADDLRNLSSILTVVETYLKDDYEKEAPRSGDPKLIRDILTDGIEEKTGQGVYKKGAVISFDRRYSLPSPVSGKLFAVGLRLHRFGGAGELVFSIGKGMTLTVGRADAKSDFTMTVKRDGKSLKSTILPAAALPSDIIFAVDANEYYVNAMSLQDSRLRAVNGRAAFSESGPFTAHIRVDAPSVTVDEFFTGVAKREVKSNTVPFSVALEPVFDPVKAGWKLVWSDEFDGKEVDWKTKWMNSPWNPVPRNRDMAYVRDGKLHIRAEFSPVPGNPAKFSGRTVGLYSQKRFGWGYYEARVRFTKTPGWWAAFWMFSEGRNMSVGGGYEIDIFEDYSTRGGKNMVANNLHVGFGPGKRSYGYHFKVPGSLDEFHTVGCKWTPFEVSFYLDGKLIGSSSRHSPYQSMTYDGINHGFCTSLLHICVSGQCGSSGGTAKSAGAEEYIVDWVRAYAYPRGEDPSVRFGSTPPKSLVKTGEKIVFDVTSAPSAVTKAKVRNVYLFDNGNLIDFKSGDSARFSFAIDRKHYADTIWASAGRSSAKAVLDSYPHLFTAAVQDEKGRVAATSCFPVIADMGESRPYKGVLPEVPGVIDTAKYDEGGNGNATYKQKRNGGTFPVGREGMFSRKKLNLREAGEWANFSFNAVRGGDFELVLDRDENRRFWPMRALVLIDGVYAGDFVAPENAEKAVLKNVSLTTGKHRLTLISACGYGVWPRSIEFKAK